MRQGSGDLFVRSWARVRRVSLDRRSSAGEGEGGAKDAACTRSLCSIRSGSTNGINSPCPLESGPSSRFLGQPAAGSVADAAEVRKIAKYAELCRRFIFQPVAVETSDTMGKSTVLFFKDIGRRLPCDFRISVRVISCSRECLWLFSGGTHQHFAVVP